MTEAVAEAAQASLELPETPYVGLVPYTEDDSAFFFGREADKTIVTANLRASRLTLLYGPSGVGKTSLLQAGVVHDLRERVALGAAAAPERAPFAIAVFRGWRDDPLPVLMETIRRSVLEAAGGAELEPWAPKFSVVETLRGWTERARTLLVVLDQFEDYFLYHPNEAGEKTFDGALPQLVNEPNLRVNFLVSIREDAWAKLDRFEGRIPQLFVNYVRIEHLDREGARDAIEGPIAEYNRRLPAGEARYTIEPELVDAVVEAASASGPGLDEGGGEGEPTGSDQVETPFLQLVMDRLWRATVEAGGRELTLSTLVQLGGAQRIVETHLVDALGALDPREQAIAADAFRYLVTSSRRRVVQSTSDLTEWLGLSEEELVPVLEKLASGESGRILRPVPPPPGRESEGRRYEIFHDVLGGPILEWRRDFERWRERRAEAERQRALRRRLALIAVGLLVLALSFAAFAGWALHERGVAADRADVAQSQALAARSIRVQSLDPKQSLALASQAEAKGSTPQADEALRRALVGWPKPTTLVRPGPTVYGVDFSPDGRLVATAGMRGARVSSIDGRVLKTLVPRKAVVSLRFSADDGRFAVAAMADGRIRVWRVAGWRELPSRARIRPFRLARAAFSADGRFIVAGGYPGWGNRVWRFADGRVGRELTKRDGVGGWIEPDGAARVVDSGLAASAARLANAAPFLFATSPRGRISVGAGREGVTPVFQTRTRAVRTELPDSIGAVFSPDGARIVIQANFGSAIWDLYGYEAEALLAGSSTSISFSPDGRLVAGAVVGTTEDRDTARIWDSENGDLLAELPPRPPRFHSEVTLDDPYPERPRLPPGRSLLGPGVMAFAGVAFVPEPTVRFSPDGNLLAAWGQSKGGAQLWEPFGTRTLEQVRTNARGSRFSLRLPTAVSPDGRLVATADRSGEIDVRSTRDGRRVARLRGSTGFVPRLAFSPESDLLAAASHDGRVRIWNVRNGGPPDTLRGHSARVGDVAFSPDGELVASASEDGTARIWSVPGGDPVRVLDEAAGPVTSVAFSSDGDMLVTAEDGGTARVWSTEDWEQRAVLGPTSSGELVLDASFSRDGRFVTTLDLDSTARIWRADGGRPIRTLKNVASVAFSPDGEHLLVADGEATARILRRSDGQEVGVLRGHTATVHDARFNQQGDLIVTAGEDATVRVWQAATNGAVAVVRPSPVTALEAMFARDGRLVVASEDGARLLWCEPCLGPARLRALAKERLADGR